MRGGSVGAIVVMGVEGCGKTTVGVALAKRLGVAFVEGDDLQPPENVARMASGHPLTDAERDPWLRAVGRELAQDRDGVVAACSALKRAYRDLLREYAPSAYFVLLCGSEPLIASRIAGRRHAYMPASLLVSQVAILEPLQPDELGVVLDAALAPDVLVELAIRSRNTSEREA
jgi:carbohydrate kinase (thermoresistant glucokinase family)